MSWPFGRSYDPICTQRKFSPTVLMPQQSADDAIRFSNGGTLSPFTWSTSDSADLLDMSNNWPGSTRSILWSINTVQKRIDWPCTQWCPPHKYFIKFPSLTRCSALVDSSNIGVPVAHSLCGQTRKMLNTYFDDDLDFNMYQTVHESSIPHMNWQRKRSAQCHILRSTSVTEMVVELKHVAVSCIQYLNLLDSWWNNGWGISHDKSDRYSGIN